MPSADPPPDPSDRQTSAAPQHAAAAPRRTGAAPRHASAAPRHASATPILVVDDDPAVRRVFCRALQRAGFECLEAADGADALELIRQRDIAMVLLDSTMPRMSGPEVLVEIRNNERTRRLPVLLVTGLGDIADRVSGLQAGADDYIVKPVHLDELVARVRATLRGQAAWASVLEVELRERAEVAATLARLRLEATPEMTAASICAELARLRELPFVGLVGFERDGGASTLAVHSPMDGPWRAGSPLARPLADALQRRAATGPWSDPRAFDADDGDGGTADEFEAIGVTATVNAPLRAQGVLLGLLVVGIRPSVPAADEELARTLPAVIDFAAIASALLGPALSARTAHGDARTRLEAVIAERAFTPVFQPIFELESGRVVGYEALTRFDDGTPPEIRFAEAARLGLGVALEAACLAAAVSAARALVPSAWQSHNVSPALVLEGVILRQVVDGADRPLLVELTEHDPVDDYPRLRAALDRLGEGARLSVDDAGSGYASLKHILALRPAFVKLDSTWVSGLQHDPARQALVAGLMYFASTTGCQLIAEGVETTEERAVLDRLAVKLGQGYLLGHPRPLA